MRSTQTQETIEDIELTGRVEFQYETRLALNMDRFESQLLYETYKG